jgi:hypothetical protein
MAFVDPDDRKQSGSKFVDPDESPKKKEAPKARTTQEIYEASKKNGWGTGFGPAMHELGGIVTDKTGSPLLGALTNFAGNAVPAFLTAARLSNTLPTSIYPTDAMSTRLMQSSIKPSTATFAPEEIKSGMRTLLGEGIYPTAGGMNKGANIVGEIHRGVNADIAASPATVKVADVASRLERPLSKAGMQVNPQPDTKAVENVWTNFLVNPHIQGKSEIPVKLAHEMKSGTYRSLGAKAYHELGSVETEAQKALARGLREEVASKVPSVVEPMKREAAIMSALEMTAPKVGNAGNLNPIGLAALRMDHPASAGMMLADRSSLLKAFLAMQMYNAGRPDIWAKALVTPGLLADEPKVNPMSLLGYK